MGVRLPRVPLCLCLEAGVVYRPHPGAPLRRRGFDSRHPHSVRRGCWKTAGLRTRRAWFDSTGGRCFMGIWRSGCARLAEDQEDPVRLRGSPLRLWDHRPMGGHRPRASGMGVRIPLVPLRLSPRGCGVTAASRAPIPKARVRPPPPALPPSWLRRSTARTADCRSVNTGSIPVGVALSRRVVQQ